MSTPRGGASRSRAGLLTNGHYSVFLTASGTGYSSFGGDRLTAWRGDRVEDRDGFFIHLKDLESGAIWSATPQPLPGIPRVDESEWHPGRFSFTREVEGIETRLEVCVAPDAPLELRRVTLRNHSASARRIELTSFAEVVLNDAAAHAAHPAFSRLFVRTEFAPAAGALLASRRPRDAGERHPWLVHALLGAGPLEAETDRARFIGRQWGGAPPLALAANAPLSGTAGDVLDPALCLRRALELAPGGEAEVVFLLGAAPSREPAIALAAFRDIASEVTAVFEAAEARERERIANAGLDERSAERLQALAAAMLRGEPALRAAPEVLARAQGEPDSLRALGVDPGAALAVVEATGSDSSPLVSSWIAAHRYWRALGVLSQLVVVSPEAESASLRGLAAEGEGVLVLSSAALTPAARDLLCAVASLVASDAAPEEVGVTTVARGSDAIEVGDPAAPADPTVPGDLAAPVSLSLAVADEPRLDEPLQCFNGYGGFARHGSEYVIRLECRERPASRRPPQPWINVISNESFGFLVSESGAGSTWSLNSREHRLTPWSNDPVLDPHGEALYIRDDDRGIFWSPLPGPVPHPGRYEMRHGFGYSRCRHESEELEQETTLFVPAHDPVKIVRIRLVNRSDRARRLSLFAYQHLVLGTDPATSGRLVVTERDLTSGILLARNRMAGEFSGRVAFAAVVAPNQAGAIRTSSDRESFLGRSGSPANPAALRRAPTLDGRTGAGLDPCFATQVVLRLKPGEAVECAFLLGECGSRDEVVELVSSLGRPGAIDRAFHEVTRAWQEKLTAVRVETPAPALDLMVNGWLLYQALSCRMWGRSAFFQSGGAYGYRDQLQDSSAWVMASPDLARSQLLLHAAHQFVEGDVLHWWHPPLHRGIRTRFVDDLLWLPYLVAHYAESTGDWGVMEERVPFLEARPLEVGELEAYLVPRVSEITADLYEHCCRAIDRSLTTGAHGLPLFGSGDWNDGMNRVGVLGRGESVWMGFFLHAVLGAFVPVCERRGDHGRALRYRQFQAGLRSALEQSGWDGQWYRRGYYDDGAPLGSSLSDECRIDALAQAWAVLSGAAPPDRARRAMEAVERHLVSERDGLIRLLTPPFDRTPRDPGYIKGYAPGVRENGGQYTHASLWVVRAMATLGWNHRAARLLEMLSPVRHTLTPLEVETYRAEPYVVAADVYGEPPHVGRGGWTWYTGSAAWMYRVALESVLGLRNVGGEALLIRPCIPDNWPQVRIRMRLPGEETRYDVLVRNPSARARKVSGASLDGEPVEIRDGAARIPLSRDGREHRIEVMLGPVGVEPTPAAEELVGETPLVAPALTDRGPAGESELELL